MACFVAKIKLLCLIFSLIKAKSLISSNKIKNIFIDHSFEINFFYRVRVVLMIFFKCDFNLKQN
jgi:hypothetical protein